MTIDIDEVIQEHLHFADLWQEKFDLKTWDQRHIGGCDKEAEKHRQTAEWLKDYKKKEEINQSLLYENERLLKSVQEIKAEIQKQFKGPAYYMPCYDAYKWVLCVIEEHMSWEGEE